MDALDADPILSRLHSGLRAAMRESSFRSLTEIQRLAIPVILDGHDCVIEAPTAGGKTEAVLFPTLTRASAAPESSVRVLYLAPLRALLNNLQGRGERYAERCNLHAFKWHGDVDQKEKLKQLRVAPALLMTTPESLEAILLRKAEWPEFFAGLQAIIIDEAHNFAAGDRGGHLLSLLHRVEQASARPPQRIAMTATIGNPEAMCAWLAGGGRAPGRRICAGPVAKPRDYRVDLFDGTGETEQTPLAQTASWRQFEALHAEIRTGRSIVFAGSRRGAEQLAQMFVRTAAAGMPEVKVRTHHSAVSRYFREEAEGLIQSHAEGALNAIISTSTLELGIDIGELNRVVQIGGLASPAAFLQRVGRTGRRPGQPQSFRGHCMEVEELVLLTATVQLGLRGESEALLFPRRAFHLLAHQLLCLSLQNNGISPNAAWARLREVSTFSGVAEDEFETLVTAMCEREYLRLADGDLVAGDRTDLEFLGTRWRKLFAVFSTAPLYDVFDGKNQVGTLDAVFVESLPVPFHFVLGGKLWKARTVDPKGHTVSAVRSADGNAPKWKSFGGPSVPFETAQEVGRLLMGREVPGFLGEEARSGLEKARAGVRGVPWEPGVGVLFASDSGTATLWTWAGDRINHTLARVFQAAGARKATAAYDAVQITGIRDGAQLASWIADALRPLANGPLASPAALARALAGTQPIYPFSPFARCLPDSLIAEALLERTLDPAGALRVVGRPLRAIETV